MKVIHTFYGPEDAYAALSLLQAHGKQAHLLDSATLSVLPLDSVALGGYRLAVPDSQVDDSLDLLARQLAPDTPEENRQYFGDQYPVEDSADDDDLSFSDETASDGITRINIEGQASPFFNRRRRQQILAFGAIVIVIVLINASLNGNQHMDWLF